MTILRRIWCVLAHRSHYVKRCEGDNCWCYCARCDDGYWQEPRL